MSFDGSLITDVAITALLPSWQTLDLVLPAIGAGQHTLTLENSGGGGVVFDYLQAIGCQAAAPTATKKVMLPLLLRRRP